MKKTSIALVIAATLGLSTAALADNTTGQGFYAGGNVGYSSVELPLTSTANWSTNGFGYNVHGGFMFNQYVGAELGYTNYANATYDQGGLSGKFKAYSVDAAAKGVYHFNPLWSVFGKLGVASLHSELDESYSSSTASSSKTKIVPLAGIGAGYDVDKNLTVNAGFTYVNGGTDTPTNELKGLGNYSFAYAGVDYHF